MPKFSRCAGHACLLGLAIVVVVPIRSALKGKYAQQRTAIQAKAINERVQELAEHWNSFTYVDGASTNLASVVLARIDWPSLQLSDVQRTMLKSRLSEVFGYLSNPRFDEYYRLKTEGFTSRFQVSGAASSLLSRMATNANESQEPVRTLRVFWDALRSTNGAGARAKITAVSSHRLRAATSATNTHRTILNGKVSNGLSVIMEAFEPGFRYGGHTNAVSSESAQGLFVHLSFFARSSASKDAGPVYLSLYWSEPDQNWALSRLFTDRVLNFGILF